MAKQIPEEVIDNIRKENDIVDVIGEYIQLKKQGRNYFGLCPFHGEKTPSFSVTQEKQIFHCFGCGKGGNVVTFVMEMEGFNFFEAIKFLADRSGVQLPENTLLHEDTTVSKENQQILSAYNWLMKLYHHLLRYTKDGKEGYQYFKNRGIEDEAIDTFQLGFAPNVKDFTAKFLEKKGFHQQALVKAGLLTLRQDHSVVDRFAGRVIFPIRNHLGKTVAFGGRALLNQGPKYLNSSENELFHKSRILYNFDLAKKYLRKMNEVVLFEGYMDVISSYQAGIKNVVATLGTALTESQAKLLRRYVDTVIICYDSDQAGMEGAYKAATLLQATGCQVKIANLNNYSDPDNYIQDKGADTFRKEVIEASDTFMTFYMRYLKKGYNLSLEGDRIQYIEKVLRKLAKIESSVEREVYVKELNIEFDLTTETLQKEIDKYRQEIVHVNNTKDKWNKDSYTNKVNNNYHKNNLLPAYYHAEKHLLAYMLQDKTITDKVQDELGASFNLEEHQVIATHLYAFYEEEHQPDIGLFIERLHDSKYKQLVTEIAMSPFNEQASEKVINDYIKIIRTETSEKTSIKQLKHEQRLAEQQKDHLKAAQIAMQIIELQKKVKI